MPDAPDLSNPPACKPSVDAFTPPHLPLCEPPARRYTFAAHPAMSSDPAAMPACAAILVAAGTSQRMGFDKLSAPLGGMPVLRRALEALLAARGIGEVIVVGPPEREALWLPSPGKPAGKPIRRVDGGATRQESVARGLAAVSPAYRWIAVHDGARPLVSANDIDRCIAAAIEHRAATLARRATDTMKHSDADGFCTETVPRDFLWCMETPQVFDAGLLREASRHAAGCGLVTTDEVTAVQAVGARVKCVESSAPNLKITTPSDLALAEALLQSR